MAESAIFAETCEDSAASVEKVDKIVISTELADKSVLVAENDDGTDLVEINGLMKRSFSLDMLYKSEKLCTDELAVIKFLIKI